MSKQIRAFPVERDDRRVMPHLRDIRLKVLSDIDAYIRQREYGKASALLQTIVNTGSIQVKEIWNPLIAVIRAQDHTSLGVFLDLIITETRTQPPFAASMERFFVALDSNYDDAYAIILAFSTDTGSKLAMAHGFLGIIIACLRELELRRNNVFTATPHVFRNSEFAQFVTSADEEQRTKYSLTNAERHLERALELDPECDFFVPFHAQVLVALGRTDFATHMLERRYAKDKNIVVLRMLMSLDPRDVVEQSNRMLDYLELDPFAPEAYFNGYITRCIDQWDQLPEETISRVFLIIIDRIERGDPRETDKWKYMALFTARLRTTHPCVCSVMDQRLHWWHMYFDWPQFMGTITDVVVYKAVCAQQWVDLEPGHPVYNVLSGELTDDQAAFVNNIRATD
ncbi:hypothetical protein IWW56_000246 [Coemansia sp. RSA 2131]|nr:hypothetical protein IWW56_000246 [Coemansia sp. RSA 2131]